ncbi:hypothetical protein F8E02_11650 [Methanoculleus sp. Wushi-C6]|uniref:Thioredoxin domain-containing protein n=1 Tax=Methanoculleus caldifontis TaxID=2651577 RepID=A0ABU3X5D7_9EURY|nr:hypothetical protein [Methanoculleus sp. Wushi-C6]
MVVRTVEEPAAEYARRVSFAKCNVDGNGRIAAIFEIPAAPTLIFFANSLLADRIIGMQSTDRLHRSDACGIERTLFQKRSGGAGAFRSRGKAPIDQPAHCKRRGRERQRDDQRVDDRPGHREEALHTEEELRKAEHCRLFYVDEGCPDKPDDRTCYQAVLRAPE